MYYKKQDQSNKLLYTVIDYLFWVLLIIFTNPGGIFEALKIWYVAGRITINDILFVLLTLCYFAVPKTYNNFDIDFLKVKKYLIIFLLYYLIVFAYIIPAYNENLNNSLLIALVKSRWTIFNILLFIYTYDFFKRRWDIFLKLFLYSSILIIILFIQVIITKVTLLPIDVVNRDFININRYIMFSYGFMPLLIPLGAIAIIFKVKFKKNLILFGFFLMSIAWLVSITRRHIIGILVYFVLAFLIDAYIRKRYEIILTNTVKIIILLFSVVLISFFIVPRYLSAAWIGIEESLSIAESGKNLKGEKDVRMTFNRPFINQQFYKHPLFGTGFDDRWRTGKGDAQGYEASDYPFLAALAMYGIIGVLVFMPVYIILIKSLKKDFDFFRKNGIHPDALFLLFFTLILFFVFHLLQYFNYFVAISVSGDITWYFCLSIYLAARSDFYNSNLLINREKQLSFQE